MRHIGWIALVLVACDDGAPAATNPSAAPSASAASTAFDIDGFCEKTLAVGRPCEGDDDILEGNKIGLCTTTLREAEQEGATLDPALAPACIQEAEAGKPLPDLRTLETLVARFAACRKLLSPIASLAKVAPKAAGSAAAGQACASSADCAHGLFCPDAAKRSCAAKKKAGESCAASEECLGRCSAEAGKKCVAFCGSG